MPVLALVFLFLSSCSVYRSQGRRDFETNVPERVPISIIFHCQDTRSSLKTTEIIELKTLKTSRPDLVIHENINGQTVVLLASRDDSSTICISDSLDLAEYVQNLDF